MIIKSLLDTDQYKLSMQQLVLHQFPGAQVKYRFACRNSKIDLSLFAGQIRKEIDSLGELRFKDDELDYLSRLRFIKKDYVEFLRLFRMNPSFVKIETNPFRLTIEGPWLHTILFEVPVLALINETYFAKVALGTGGQRRLRDKLDILAFAPKDFKLAEFGTRRRYSGYWQDIVVQCLAKSEHFVGTSNVMLAKKHNLTPIGTMAHELIQAGQAFVRISESQKHMLDCWVREYRGDLGIALSDTLGIDAFIRDFDLYFAKLYDGIRWDSGDAYEFGEKVIAHYKKLGIDPMTKTLVFTDSLDIPRALKIHDAFRTRIKTSFGLGTNLTNDLGPEPINIVVKMIECNGQPVAKLSDDPGKQACDDLGYLAYLKSVFGRTD